MKYYSRLKMFKASNVTFDPFKCRAYSYDWYCFLDRIGGRTVLNDYRYSTSTGAHVSKVRREARQAGIEIDLYIEAPRGLQNLEAAVRHYENKISRLNSEIETPRSKREKNIERQREIDECMDKIEVIEELILCSEDPEPEPDFEFTPPPTVKREPRNRPPERKIEREPETQWPPQGFFGRNLRLVHSS